MQQCFVEFINPHCSTQNAVLFQKMACSVSVKTFECFNFPQCKPGDLYNIITEYLDFYSNKFYFIIKAKR